MILWNIYEFYKNLAFASELGYSDIRKRRERSLNAAVGSFFFYTLLSKIFCIG